MASAEGLPEACPRTQENAVACSDILSGYKPPDFPDLSARRFPPGVIYSTALRLPIASPSVSDPPTTRLVTLLAAVGRIIGALAGCSDVLIGLVDDDKSSIRPVRITWSDSQTWKDVIDPLDDALRRDALPRDTLHALQHQLGLSEKQSPFFATVRVSQAPAEACDLNAPISFAFNPSDNHLSIAACDKYVHKNVLELFKSQLVALLDIITADPATKISSLPNLPHELISIYEKLPLEQRKQHYWRVPHVQSATDHLSLRSAADPNLVAVRWFPYLAPGEDPSTLQVESITYSEWNKLANQFGRWLIRKGLQVEDRVAVCMPRNTWFHVAFIGILRAGGCYVPIDPELPSERQLFIAQDSGARFVITSSEVSSSALFGAAALDVSDPKEQDAIQRESHDELRVPGPEDLSYLLYTSGTTGTPKGCLLTHKGLTEAVWALADMCARVPMDDPKKGNYLSIASVAFDVHLAEILVPLATGIPIISAPRSLLLEDLPFYIKELGISHLGIVPSLIEATMGAIQDDVNAGHTSTLRYIASGGEKMSDAILDKWANHPTVRLANFYGPSEVTIGCAARFMERVTPRANIGSTFANVSAFVVDENLNIVLRGAPGELVVEGPLVGRGYHGRPDLTQKVFLEFPEKGQGRWAYRTGDLVRMMPDGTLEILGRIDTQIKLRGVRIESEGISSIVRNGALPDLSIDAVTVLAKHPSIGVDQLVTFIAWDSSISIGTRKTSAPTPVQAPPGLLTKIRNACEQGLASYMRPSHIIPLSWIPLNSNGKTDAKALVQLFTSLDLDVLTRASGETELDGDEPLGDDSKEIVAVVADFLHMPPEKLRASSNLFEFGLDSMGAIKLAARLRSSFKVDVSAGDIMQDPTIRNVARQILQASSSPGVLSSFVDQFASTWRDEVANAYPSVRTEDILPPFPVQEGVLSRSIETPTMYVQHVLFKCKPETSMAKLRDAWKTVMSDRSILRTLFFLARDLVQVILHPDDCHLPWSENQTDLDNDDEFRNWFLSTPSSQLSIDINEHLSETPGFRLSHYYSPSQHYLVLSIHHALFDGISLPLLLNDVERAYLHHSLQPTPPASRVLDSIHAIDVEKARLHWTQLFAGFDWRKTVLRETSSSKFAVASQPFSTALSALQDRAATQRTTVQALLMSAYAFLLATTLYGEDDVVFGVIRSGRLLPVEGVENAPYPLLCVTPFRVNFQKSNALLQEVQHDVSTSVNYEHVPLSKIQHWIREGGGLFETLFSMAYKEVRSDALWTMISSQNPEPEYVLAVEVVINPEEDQLIVHAAFTSDIPQDIAEGIVKRLEDVALQLSEDETRDKLLAAVVGSRTATPDTDLTADVVETEGDKLPIDEGIVDALRRVVAGFLRIAPDLISEDTSLIGLGLDSIRSVGLSRNLRAQGFQLSSVDIMRSPTIRRMAVTVGNKQHETPHLPSQDAPSAFEKERDALAKAINLDAIKLGPGDTVNVYPTTALQAGMLSQTVASEGRLYNHVFPLRLHDQIDIPRLRNAWMEVIKANAILRTSFHFVSDLGVWVQAVHSDVDLKWSDGTSDQTGSADDYLRALVSSMTWESGEGFSRPPIFLHLINDESHAQRSLLLVMHHALYDGLSVGRLLQLVQEAYHRGSTQPSAQFFDVLPQLLKEERHGTSFWAQKLRDLDRVKRMLRREGVKESASYVAIRPISISKATIESARSLASVTVQAIAQTAYAKLLAVLTESTDVVFGHVVAGRNVAGAEDILGPLLNTIPSRVQLKPDANNLDVILSVHAANIDALGWAHASLRTLQKALGVSELWDSLFVFQPMPPKSLHAEPIWEFDDSKEKDSTVNVQYALNVEVHETKEGFVIKSACRGDVFDAPGLESALARYEDILLHLINNLATNCLEDIPEATPVGSNDTHSQTKVAEDPVPSVDETDKGFIALRDLIASTTKIPPENIHPATSLIALGVDSITAIQVAGQLRRSGARIRAEDILRSRIVADLFLRARATSAVDAMPSHTSPSADISIPPAEVSAILARFDAESRPYIEGVTALSSGIKWLVGAWQRSHRLRHQHAFVYRLPEDVEVGRLQSAWLSLLERHSILRSSIACAPGSQEPRLVIFKPDPLLLNSTWSTEHLDSSTMPEQQVEARMRMLVCSPPSMKRPPTRGLLLSSEQDRFLIVYMHHFQYDAWSLQLLMDDLGRLYAGDAPVSSNDLTGWLRTSLPTNAAVAEQEAYWKSIFPAPLKPSYFPQMCQDTSAKRSSHKRTIYTNTHALTDTASLQGVAQSRGLSLNAVFLSAWSKVQAAHTSNDSVTFGLWHSGRSLSFDGVERLAIPCMNVLPVHVNVANTGGIVQLASRIQEDLRRRSPMVEQTDLVQLDTWTGGNGQPLCNVYVNIVKVAPDVADESHRLVKPLEVPYFVPEEICEADDFVNHLQVADLIKDDIMIDIIELPSGSVVMSLEAAEPIMTVEQAQQIVEQWANTVREALA
ncbi:hypothetical protein K474DRAFT_1654750 [Panus rudis PR-1116 ss-1]|nr:hypothetical protein K474DRAFT_1654750 [Panus rudis PR-1116 ss-1]